VYISEHLGETVTKHGGESQNRKVGERVTEGHPGWCVSKNATVNDIRRVVVK